MKGKISTELLIVVSVIALALVGSLVFTKTNSPKPAEQEIEYLFFEDNSVPEPVPSVGSNPVSEMEIKFDTVDLTRLRRNWRFKDKI